MSPTMKLRWVKRQNNRPVTTGIVSCGDGMVFVLQQWWEPSELKDWDFLEQDKEGEWGQWRDIPMEDE